MILPPPLPREEREALILRAQAGDADARRRVIESYTRMAWKLARGREDLAIAIIAIDRALTTFDASQGCSFSTYARRRVLAELARERRRNASIVMTAYDLRPQVPELQRLGREAFVARHGELHTQRVERVPRADRSMDASIDDLPTLHERLGVADDYERFEAMADYRARVLPHLAALSDREREVIAARYLATDETPTLEQIGEGMGVSRERVRQLEGGALRELRRRATTRPPAPCQAQRKVWTNGQDRG